MALPATDGPQSTRGPGAPASATPTPAQTVQTTLAGGGAPARRTTLALLRAAHMTGHSPRDLGNADWLNALPPNIRQAVLDARAQTNQQINETFSKMIAEQAALNKAAHNKRQQNNAVVASQERSAHEARLALGRGPSSRVNILTPPAQSHSRVG